MSLTNSSNDDKNARVRDLLSSYYGTAANAQEPTRSPVQAPKPEQSRSKRLDSYSVDQDRYLNQLLKTTKLQQLLQEHLSTSAEIYRLDSDMQMPVYENYNKFISATDTIRAMKTNVDNMDADMRTLMQTIEKVSESSKSINTKLQKRHGEVEYVTGLKDVVQKLLAPSKSLTSCKVQQGEGQQIVAKDE